MKKLLLFILPILLLCAGCTFANNKIQGGLMDKKILIAYFSWGGNTQSIAEKIHSQTGGEMFRIETAVPYPTDYNEAENAVSKYFSDDAYSKAVEPKELFVIKDATHVDLYDVPEYMGQALEKLDNYFKEYLK